MQIMAANKKYAVAAGGDPGAITADGVYFGGTASRDYLLRTSAFTGASDNNTFIHSYWQYGNGTSTYFFTGGNSTTDVNLRTQLFMVAGQITYRLWDGANPSSIVTTWSSSGTTASAGQWNHILVARNGSTYQCYINDTSAGGATGQSTANNIHTVANTIIDGTFASKGDWIIEMGEYYFTNEYLDISVESNRRKFITAGGDPADMNSDGSGPTGSAPLIYLSGPASTWNAGTNASGNGDFTMTGAVTDSSNDPIGLP